MEDIFGTEWLYRFGNPHGDENNLFPDAYLPYLNYDE
jgi:hypothetical protein